jgi:hypothetical protein
MRRSGPGHPQRTVILPFISSGWIRQMKSYVPARVKRMLTDVCCWPAPRAPVLMNPLPWFVASKRGSGG